MEPHQQPISPRKQKPCPKKQPQRGLGVAQLEKLRLQEEGRQFRDLERPFLIFPPLHEHPHLPPFLHVRDIGSAPVSRKDATRSIVHGPLNHASLGIPSMTDEWEHDRCSARRCSGWSIENADVANYVGIDGIDEYVTAVRKRSRLHVDKLEERHLHDLQKRMRLMEQPDFLLGSLTKPSCGSRMLNHHGTEAGETVAAGLPWVQLEPVIIKSADIYQRPNHNLVRPVVQSAVATNVRILLAATSSSIVTSAVDELSSFQTLMHNSGAHTTNADELSRNTRNIGFCDRESRKSGIGTATNYWPAIPDETQYPFCCHYSDVSSCLPGKILTHFRENQFGHRNSKCITLQEYFEAADISEGKSASVSEINLTAEADSTESCSYPGYLDTQIKQGEGTANDRGCKSRPQQGSAIGESYTNRSKSEQSCSNTLLDLATVRSTVSPQLGELNSSSDGQGPRPAPAIDLTLKLAF